MCRLILAVGDFRAADILDAAVAMSCGRTADHDGPTDVHPNGWGAVWQDSDAPDGLAFHRDERPLGESHDTAPFISADTGFLAVHARHATLPKNHGPAFTHPLHRAGEVPWYFMHNGFLPTVHRLLGLPESSFDSREYFDWAVPAGTRDLDETGLLARLADIPPGGSSGNAIAVSPYRAHVIHWTTPGNRAPRYFGMFRLRTADAEIVSSEIVPALAPPARWTPLEPGSLLSWNLRPAAPTVPADGPAPAGALI